MGIRFILMVNKQGQTRLAQYFEYLTLEERRALQAEIVRKCLAHNDQQNIGIIKLYTDAMQSLFFLVGVDIDECELDIMFHLEKAHFMVEVMVMNECVVETSKSYILTPIQLMDKTS